MDNQHKLIKGYRDLSQEEITLMNEIKAHERNTLLLVERAKARIASQHGEASTPGEVQRLAMAGPERWAAMAKTDFECGFMKLVRAVAQPLNLESVA